jgi:hypothetical protein
MPLIILILGLVASTMTISCRQIERPQEDKIMVTGFDSKAHQGLKINSCNDCHESNRPGENEGVPGSPNINNPVRDIFFHSAEFGGNLDCINCHKKPANTGVSFAGAEFDHTNYPEKTQVKKCLICHEGHRPPADRIIYSKVKGRIEDAYFHDKNFAGLHDCSECHSDPLKIGEKFNGAKFPHKDDSGNLLTTCNVCHNDQRPDPTIGAPDDEPNKFFHNTQLRGDQDCGKCHTKNIGEEWGGNKYDHLDLNGVMMNTCKDCHHDRQLKDHKDGDIKDEGRDCTKCHSLSTQPGGAGTPAQMTWERPKRVKPVPVPIPVTPTDPVVPPVSPQPSPSPPPTNG